MAKYLKKSQPEMRGSFGFLGGLSMMSRSGGLKPRAVAGRPSVTRLTHSSWTGIKASGRPKMAVRKILDRQEKISEANPDTGLGREWARLPHQTTSPTLDEMRYRMNCFMLL